MSKKDEYEFNKAIKEIEDLRGRGTELISLYIPPDKSLSDVSSYINQEMSESSNIKSKRTRKNVQSALKSIRNKLKYIDEVPENGVIFFVGEVSKEGDKTEMISKTVEPPEKLQTFTYRCDSEFHVEPLKEMSGERENYGLIVIDRSEATIGILRGNRVETLKHIQSMVPSKHSKGGQSAQRFERSIEKAALNFFRKVGEKATGLLLEEDIDGLIIGGPGKTKDDFVDEGHLHHELQKKIVDTFNTGYTDEYGLKELMKNAQETLSDLEVMKEKKLVDRLMEQIKDPDGGLATYGKEETLRALRMGAVDTLLLSDGLDTEVVKYECDNCGAHGLETEDTKSGDEEFFCPDCGSNIDDPEREDIIDFFFEEAEKVGTDVEMISDQSEQGELLLNAFGGIAGILRFRIN
ncbi:MAG: peptide chain release factor aRF-1 [Thermoplasmata archaeon]